jgi:hypothetical protein
MNWVHLATAPDQLTAELWLAILRDAGIAAMIHPSDAASYLGVAGFGCRLQVREDDLARAREVLGDEVSEEPQSSE